MRWARTAQVGLVGGHALCVERLERRQTGSGTVRAGMRGGARNEGAERPERRELVVESSDSGPVGRGASPAGHVLGLDRGLQGEAARRVAGGPGQRCLRLGQHRRGPARRVLAVEGNVLPVDAARIAACLDE